MLAQLMFLIISCFRESWHEYKPTQIHRQETQWGQIMPSAEANGGRLATLLVRS